MSDSEAIMWAVEKDPALRSDFCNLTLLDAAPDPDRLRGKIDQAIAGIPRLGQLVVSAPLRIVPPTWVDDPDLDIDYHVRRVAAPEPGGMRELLDLCAALAESAFDRSRPLWEFTVIDGLEGGRTAMLQKMHHTITDGVGGLKLSLALVDFEADPEPPAVHLDVHDESAADGDGNVEGDVDIEIDIESGSPHPHVDRDVDRLSPIGVLRDAVGDAVGRHLFATRSVAMSAGRAVTHPTEAPANALGALRMAGSLRRQLIVTGSARSSVLTGRSLRRHLEVFTIALPAAREAAQRLGGTINDLYVTGVAGALGRYAEKMGGTADELRMAMPVSTRERGEQAANRFVPTRLLVPTDPHDARERFALIADRLRRTRSEPAVAAAELLAGFASGLPTSMLVAATHSQTRTIDFATSNLRGSPVPLYLAGARIVANYPIGPRTGCALNVTLLSYCDELHMGLNIDPAAVTDIQLLMACLDESFAELLQPG
jgi:diacylglycerol O-acyltransferase